MISSANRMQMAGYVNFSCEPLWQLQSECASVRSSLIQLLVVGVQVQQLQQQLAEAQQALEAAAAQTDELQQKVEKYSQVHKNLVKAEKEVELLASASDRLLRQARRGGWWCTSALAGFGCLRGLGSWWQASVLPWHRTAASSPTPRSLVNCVRL